MTTGGEIRMPLVLSVFPGVGLLDRAFEEEGFTVVRGPDLLWGGDVRKFHVPGGVFAGVIGGPPCQAFSCLSNIVRAKGIKPAVNLIPEYERIVGEAKPAWFVMENVAKAPAPSISGYRHKSYLLQNRWFGGEQMRVRRITFGTPAGIPLPVLDEAFGCKIKGRIIRTVTASDGRRNGGGLDYKKRPNSISGQVLTFEEACEAQGLPRNFLEGAPFTKEGRYRVVGNGVPLHLGRAVARAVKAALKVAA